MTQYKAAFEFTNTTDMPTEFVVEPWGNEYVMNSGDTIRVEVTSHNLSTIRILHTNDRITIEEWGEGVSTGIWLNGTLVG